VRLILEVGQATAVETPVRWIAEIGGVAHIVREEVVPAAVADLDSTVTLQAAVQNFADLAQEPPLQIIDDLSVTAPCP
jgi:hypothetical protein